MRAFGLAVAAAAVLGLCRDASAVTPAQAQIANAQATVLKVRLHHHYAHRRNGSLFSLWCSYNCHLVRPGAQPPLGRYGYSLYAYDQDLPLRWRYDWDATPTDNGFALIYPFIGEPIFRAGEHTY